MKPFQSISYFYLLIIICFYDLKDSDFLVGNAAFSENDAFFLTQLSLVWSWFSRIRKQPMR